MMKKNLILLTAILGSIYCGYLTSWHWGVHIFCGYLIWDLTYSLIVYVKALNVVKQHVSELDEMQRQLQARDKKLLELAQKLEQSINNKKTWN